MIKYLNIKKNVNACNHVSLNSDFCDRSSLGEHKEKNIICRGPRMPKTIRLPTEVFGRARRKRFEITAITNHKNDDNIILIIRTNKINKSCLKKKLIHWVTWVFQQLQLSHLAHDLMFMYNIIILLSCSIIVFKTSVHISYHIMHMRYAWQLCEVM